MKFRPTLVALSLGLSAAVAASSAVADGNAERGKALAYTCHGCHGVKNYKNAYPNYSVPRLGGQNSVYLENALKAYASGERPHQTMHAQASSLSDQDRADLAAFLQAEVVKPGKEVVGTPPPATQVCVTCHGADGAKVVGPEYPILAGQQADYIVQALTDYKSGKRKNPVMAGLITGVDPRDFQAIAQYFSSQPGLCSTDDLRLHDKCMNRE
jgi:cytochrome c553